VAEATEILDTLGRDLLVLDKGRGQGMDPDLVNGIFRAAHSLKGLASMFGELRIALLAHQTEDLLDRLRLGRLRISDQVLDALIESVDVLQSLLGEAARAEPTEGATHSARQLAERLQNLGESGKGAPLDEPDQLDLDQQVRSVFTEYEEHRLRENLREGRAVWKVRAVFDLADFDQGLARLSAKLKSLGEVISTLPSAEPSEGSGIAFDIIFGTHAGEDRLRAALTAMPTSLDPLFKQPVPDRSRSPREPLTSVAASSPAPNSQESSAGRPPVGSPMAKLFELPQPAKPPRGDLPAPEKKARAEAVASQPPFTQTVRVEIGRLDSLMDAVGELHLIKANLQRLVDAAQSGRVPRPTIWGQELQRESRLLERKLDELQKGILEVRMVPLGRVFEKLARMVRRIARDSGKEVDFLISGGEVELDKLIVEALSDPLLHLVRNAIDHGVEPPEERLAEGKARRSVISVRATHKGNQVLIAIADDGRGIDAERIREVALRTGVISPDRAAEMGRRELQSLIFLPGFSTAPRVSELSGRGVGLDVAKTNIARLSGSIETVSESGKGSTFTITVPETLAIIRALVVSVSGRVYAVPLNAVSEITTAAETEVKTVERREVIALRGRTIPFARLARVFRLPEKMRKRYFVVVVGLAQERLAIAVDELLGQQDVVIKPLSGRLRKIPGIAGATDLGDRSAVLVLDLGAILEEVIKPERRADVL
jgi:two-component system chemotaxis sensor kinase CheA